MSNIPSNIAPSVSKESESYVSILRTAMNSDDEGFFIRVHAAEALILNGYPEGVEAIFTDLQKASPDYFVGASRILARLYKDNPEKYSEIIDLLVDRILNAEVIRQRLTALESLGKLDFKEPLPEIVQFADTGTDGFKSLARWVLANSGAKEDEARLAELLTSSEVTDYRGASYAIRFLNKIEPSTYNILEATANRLPQDADGRVYVLSALFVHTHANENIKAKSDLLFYLEGEVAERYEAAEGLSLAGIPSDIPVLEALLKDSSTDVQVAAANAIIKIQHRADFNVN